MFAASISYQFALCLCIVGFELGVISHDDQWTGRYWTVRGLLYAFLGVIAHCRARRRRCNERNAVTMKEGKWCACLVKPPKALEKYSVVAASAVIATGALYVLLGLCCCRGIRRGAQLRYRRRLAHAELQRAYLAERSPATATPVAPCCCLLISGRHWDRRRRRTTTASRANGRPRPSAF